jgi:two-component system LytT family response regulator
MKVLIIDDEPLAREELYRLLGTIPQVQVIGEAGDVPSARQLIGSLRPDLIFLDVEMSRQSGFDLATLEPPQPSVIFTTAYDAHAVNAFRTKALDFLLKPVDAKQLADAVARLQKVAPRTVVPSGRLHADARVFVRDNGRCWFVKVEDIWLLESEGNYTRLYFEDVRPMVYRPLKAFEARLDPSIFFRANRHQIINLTKIEKTEYNTLGELVVTLCGGKRVELSRRMSRIFYEQLSV